MTQTTLKKYGHSKEFFLNIYFRSIKNNLHKRLITRKLKAFGGVRF